MGLFTSLNLDSLDDLFHEILQDLYDAEQRIHKYLPRLRDAAKNEELQQLFAEHAEETERQILRLERVFEIIGKSPSAKTCEATQGLIAEAKDVEDATGSDDVRDAALIAAAQRLEHYEIASYGTLRTFARRLGLEEAAELLQTTLDEECATDHRLTAVAEQTVNANAASE